MRISIFLVWPVILLSCATPSEKPVNKFADPVLLKIADLKDRRLADSLYPFFGHENATYRSEAVLAFGSIQETSDVDKIGKLMMMDPNADVRRSAAFALGQIAHPSSERLLLGALVKEKESDNIFTILEAYGKSTSQWKLQPEAFLDDTLKSAGLAWSLYRAALRGKTDSSANAVARRLLDPSLPVTTRLGAAHYFARGATNFSSAEEALVRSCATDKSPAVRMASALALGKLGSESALDALKNVVEGEKDPRAVVNAAKALRSFEFDKARAPLYECLRHKDIHVRLAASEVIRDIAPASDWISVSSLTNQENEWSVNAILYEAALKTGQRKDIAEEIRQHYTSSSDIYVRAALLGSMKYYPAAYDFVYDELKKADTAVIRSAAAATLVAMNYSEHFSTQYRRPFAQMFSEIIESTDDPAVIGRIASALGDSVLRYREVIKDHRFLVEAREKLKLPQHIEALNPLESAIAYFEHRKAQPVQNAFNHPIDWELVRQIPEDLQVVVKTTRGHMTLRLFVNDAPGSVANFVTLARSGYFNGKPFHRVVPNFVIQTGCNRGDGWGSEDYSIRSEFSFRRFATGSVGMASAGKDTEGTQWFVTHSPTPHLDGRYTNFGEIAEGLKVMNYIQVGDQITDVEVEDFNAR